MKSDDELSEEDDRDPDVLWLNSPSERCVLRFSLAGIPQALFRSPGQGRWSRRSHVHDHRGRGEPTSRGRFHRNGCQGQLPHCVTWVWRSNTKPGIDRYLTAESRRELTVGAAELRPRRFCTRRVWTYTELVAPRLFHPQPNGSWATSDVFTALHEQLRTAAQAPLTSPVWELHLLLLSKSDRKGLLGVMPDFVDDLPRQGAAVFVDAIDETLSGCPLSCPPGSSLPQFMNSDTA